MTDVPNASEAPIDFQDRSRKEGSEGADMRDQERNAHIEEEQPLPDYVPPLPESNLRDND